MVFTVFCVRCACCDPSVPSATKITFSIALAYYNNMLIVSLITNLSAGDSGAESSDGDVSCVLVPVNLFRRISLVD